VSKPSYRKFIRKLREQSEADGEGQAGDPGDGYWEVEEEEAYSSRVYEEDMEDEH